MVPSVIVMVGIPLLQKTVIDGEPFEKDELRCVISTDGKSPMNYAVGFEYEMLTLFAWQMGKTVDISLGGLEYLDSLATGNVDILVPMRIHWYAIRIIMLPCLWRTAVLG